MKTSRNRMQFESLLSNVAPLLDAEGFKRRSEAFYKTVAGRNMHLIIDFQRSASHDYDQLKFTINLGVFSSHLCKHTWGKVPRPPSIWDAQIQERIGFLLPRRK